MKLSIIVPVYNVEPYLARCIDSILKQTITDFELILVDDGSPDGCPVICDEYAGKDARVKVIHKENGGLSDARNAGLDIARGEYIGFVDSDDFIHPQMYEILYRVCIQTKSDIVQCKYVEFDDMIPREKKLDADLILESAKIYERCDYIEHYFSGYWWIIGPTVCNKLFRRNVFEKIRFPVGKLFEDSNVHIQLLNETNHISTVDCELYFYCQRSGSIMHSSYTIKRAVDMNEICEKLLIFFENANNEEQIYYAEENYLTRYLRDKFAVWECRPELKTDFQLIERRMRKLRWRILKNPKICRMKKVVFLIQFISAKNALKICRRYFPECIHIFMR